MTNKGDQLEEIQKIEPSVIFGFDGDVNFGLLVHNDSKHIIFALGKKIAISTLNSLNHEYLSGHTKNISCLCLSESGRFLGSGQEGPLGFRAYVILWDWETKKAIGRHDVHKGKVQSLCFTSGEKFLASVGGQDDGTILVYDVEARTLICQATSAKAISGNPITMISINGFENLFMVCGDKHFRFWKINKENKQIIPIDISTGKLQRRFTCMRIDETNKYMYLGTMTGDILKVRLYLAANEDPNASLMTAFARHIPNKPKGKDCISYANGIRAIHLVNKTEFLVGAGDGQVELVTERTDICFKDYVSPVKPALKTIKSEKVNGSVTTIAHYKDDKYLIGTNNSEIYLLRISDFDLKLIHTCHKKPINCIEFPKNFSSAFVTASYESIRIWSVKRMKELLRIMVYNFVCNSVVFSDDGSCLVSAWNDGIIRTFTPITGRLIYAIPNAHNKGVSAVKISSNGKTIVSGGIEGQVRVWKIEPKKQSLVGVLKEHSAPIASISFNNFQNEVVSASSDGSCVIWDIKRLARKIVIYANTQFQIAIYHPSGVQILTAGSDRNISYWETFDGSKVRDVAGSSEATINDIAISANGEYFISVSSDQLIKLWNYQKGITLCYGSAHASSVSSCAYSPDGKFFVTGSCDGALIIWNIPPEFHPKQQSCGPDEKSKKPSSEGSSIDSKISPGSKRINDSKMENIDRLETVSKGNLSMNCAT